MPQALAPAPSESFASRVVGSVVSVQTGRIALLGPEGSQTRSAFVKTPVSGPAMVRTLGLDGDQQADRRYHGGPEMALLGYAMDHYPAWREELGLTDAMGPGGFGENLTLTHLTEATVAIGDIHHIGTARLQVAQHRGPCSKIEKRWCIGGMVKRVTETSRCGWYYRVLTEGAITAGDAVVLESSPYPQLTIERLFQATRQKRPDPALTQALVDRELLTLEVREELQGKL